MNCTHCQRPVADAAHFCSACGHMLRRPPPEAPLAPAWRAWLGGAQARPTLLGVPAVDDTTPVAEPAPLTGGIVDEITDENGFEPDDFDGPSLDPPEGFRETAWFREAEDPDALSEIEHDDRPAAERGARYRTDRAVVEEAARRAYSLAYDPEEER